MAEPTEPAQQTLARTVLLPRWTRVDRLGAEGKAITGPVLARERHRRTQGNGELLAIMAGRHRGAASHPVSDPILFDLNLDRRASQPERSRDLGYSPAVLSGRSDHVVIDYTVQSGKFAGTNLRLGFVVPADFPITPPSGLHVSSLIHPFKSRGDHPTGGVHRDQAMPFQQTLQGEWQYWSRPPADWANGKKTVAAYMGHVWRLWDSQ